jgi:heme-degrading monooxygenase HmoA
MIAELDLTVAQWTQGPLTAADGPVLVSVTDFHVARARDLPAVWAEGLRLRRAWPSMPGAVGMWLWAKPLRRRSGSVSVWRSEDDLRRFVRWPRHVEIMRRYRDSGELVSCMWPAEHFDRAQIWSAARRRLATGT